MINICKKLKSCYFLNPSRNRVGKEEERNIGNYKVFWIIHKRKKHVRQFISRKMVCCNAVNKQKSFGYKVIDSCLKKLFLLLLHGFSTCISIKHAW